MARLSDVPVVIRKIGLLTFLKRVWAQTGEDEVFTWSAALAYAWLFAVFPFLIFLLTLIPYLPPQYKQDTREYIEKGLQQLPKESQDRLREDIEGQLKKLLDQKHSGVGVIGILLTLWAASGGMAMTMSAIDRAYDVKKHRPYYFQRPLAVLLTAVCSILIVAVIVLMPVCTSAIRYLTNHTEKVADWLSKWTGPFSILPQFVRDHVGAIVVVWQTVRYSLALLLMLALVAVVYNIGPNVKQRWRLITPGAVFAIVVWLGFGSLFRFYFDTFANYNKTYGTLAGVAILLLLFYIDAVVFLVGAEINSEIDYDILNVPVGTYDLRSAERELRRRQAEEATSS